MTASESTGSVADAPGGNGSSPAGDYLRDTPAEVMKELDEIGVAAAARVAALDPELQNAVAFTHFDTSGSKDNVITALLVREDIHRLASQTLVRIKSTADKRNYLGVVVSGPFSEPDAVPANSTMAVGVVMQGKRVPYTFDYHGRIELELLGEEVGGQVVPPRYRPRPKSPVFVLDEAESARVLGVGGDLCFGRVVGYENTEARVNSKDKAVLPRHTAIIGTTGGGKSTTVAQTIERTQSVGIATIVFDVEGEYTHVDQPTDHPAMLEALRRRGMNPQGVKDLHILRLVGRESTNPGHKKLHDFSLSFSSLSPYAIAEILEMSDAQHERFLKAYDIAKLLLNDFGIFPVGPPEQREALEVDELTTGYPKMRIQHVLDVVSAYIYALSDEGKADAKAAKKTPAGGRGRKSGPGSAADVLGADDDEEDGATPAALMLSSEFQRDPRKVLARVHQQKSSHEISWKALAGKLHRLRRLQIFDMGTAAPAVNYSAMLQPGRVTVVDLSDTDSPQVNNLVIADILRGLQDSQEGRYKAAAASGIAPVPTLIIIEEAHEFLSSSRVSKMPVLFENVARIAKRGRKRWLGLVFVTQLPQHLPNEVLGLVNNFIIHKITDSTVISRMQRTIGSIDESLWNRVPRLAPGQALLSFSSFTRPLLVAIDPAPCKRLLVE